MVSTLTWSKLKKTSSTHRGCPRPLRKTRDFVLTPCHPSQSRGHRWRRWTGPGTPQPCTHSHRETKCCYFRGTPPACLVALPEDGPRRSGACSPGGDSAVPPLLLGQSRDRWTQTCARHAYIGCNPRRTAHRPLGSRRPLLRKGNRKQWLALWLAKPQWQFTRSGPLLWLAEMHTRTCSYSTAD